MCSLHQGCRNKERGDVAATWHDMNCRLTTGRKQLKLKTERLDNTTNETLQLERQKRETKVIRAPKPADM